MTTTTLNDDELWLVNTCKRGYKADFTQRPKKSGTATEISADVIRQLLLGQLYLDGQEAPVQLPLGLQVRGATICGRLRLANLTGGHDSGHCPALVFEDCVFQTAEPWPAPGQRAEPTVDLRHARYGRVSFTGCQLAMIALDGASIDGDLDLSTLHAPSEDLQCWISARGARVQGRVRLSGASLHLAQRTASPDSLSLERDWACDLQGMVISANLLGDGGLKVLGGMVLPREVHGNIDLRGATMVCDSHPRMRSLALFAEHTEVGGTVYLRPQQQEHAILPFECYGILNLYSMKIGGSLELCGGRFFGPPGDDADPAILACMIEVRDTVFMGAWGPQPGLPSSGASWPTIVQGSRIDFQSARIGKSVSVALRKEPDMISLAFHGLCVGGDLYIEHMCQTGTLTGMRIGNDLALSAADDAQPSVDLSGSTIQGNVWLTGQFQDIRARHCSVQGKFGDARYNACRVAVPASTIHGPAHFLAYESIYIEAAKVMGHATISSTRKEIAISVQAKNLCAGQDVTISGPISKLDMTMAAIGGDLNAQECAVNHAALDRLRAGGDVRLPKALFGPLSLVGGRIDGAVYLHDITLHRRQRPSGDTKPSISLHNTRIDGDLQVRNLVRKPESGALEELGETPAWLATIDHDLQAQDDFFMLCRTLSFYKGAQVIELHLPSTAAPDSNASVVEMDCHAFLLLADGRTVYLNGESPPIHRVNEVQNGSRLLQMDTEEQALDYLRFFCGYVWGDKGAFIIMESKEPSDWLQYQDRKLEGEAGTLLDNAPVPPRIQRDHDEWVCDALMLYDDYLFIASLRIAPTGMVVMSDDTPVAALKLQGVSYPKPYRRYRLGWDGAIDAAQSAHPAPVHQTPHRVIRDDGWQRVTDAAMHTTILDRIRHALTRTKEKLVPLYSEWPIEIDLRGCRCSALDDDSGKGWGNELSVDLRGFEYLSLAEEHHEFNETVSGTSHSDTGAVLGKQRIEWLERVTRRLLFSVSPYEQLVRVFARRGDPAAARTVLERRLQCENQRQPTWSRRFIWLGVQLPFRFGLFSRRALIVTALYWVLGIIAFDIANYGALRLPPVGTAHSKLVVAQLALPMQPVLMVNSQPVTMSVATTLAGDKLVTAKVPLSDNMAHEVSCGDQVEPILYALDVMLPLIDLQQESKCSISSADELGPLLWRLFRALYAVIGAYITSMLILTLSGVLRRSTER